MRQPASTPATVPMLINRASGRTIYAFHGIADYTRRYTNQVIKKLGALAKAKYNPGSSSGTEE